jgi:hypothetical protein
MDWKKIRKYLIPKYIWLALLFISCSIILAFIIVWVQVIESKEIGIIVTVLLAFMQAVFAFFLLLVHIGNKKINAEQTRFNKILPMITEYNGLANTRYNFWRKLEELYRAYNSNVSDAVTGVPSLSYSITVYTFPRGFDPSEKVDLRDVLNDNSDDWNDNKKNSKLWGFATYVYNGDADQDRTEIDKYRSRLVYFWNTWAREQKDLLESIEPDRNELLMLTWLELALAWRTEGAKGAGKTALFQLAKDKCKSDDL